MPPPPLIKDIVASAVLRAEGLITLWPKSFPSLAEAEKYIGNVLSRKLFRYGISPDAPFYAKCQVKQRTRHRIALKAYKTGVFALSQPPPSPKLLRDAVEVGIKRAEAVIERYPKSFPHINAARSYIKNICQGQGIEFPAVEHVHPSQVAMYIHYNTARRAYEDGEFYLDEEPDAPYPTKYRQEFRYQTAARSTNSAQTYSTPPTSPSKSSTGLTGPIMNEKDSEMQRGNEEKIDGTTNRSNEIAHANLIDVLDVSTSVKDNDMRVCNQHVDLFQPASGELGALIDLKTPEIQPPLSSDMMDLIDVFMGESRLVQDEAFNELATEIVDGQLTWNDQG